MLKLSFLNVGDGDAALIEDTARGFRMLADTGRAVPRRCGPQAMTAAEHLARLGIDHLDEVVVTHLHKDHFGGLEEVLERVRVERVWCGFFPERDGLRAQAEPEEQKTVVGLIECLNLWARTTEKLRRQGCETRLVTGTVPVAFTDGLRGRLICPNSGVAAFQRKVYGRMLAGEPVGEEYRYWASKARNPNSLRLQLTYAGQRVELAGDCYGMLWEDDAEPCALLKVPHHGDAKALTGTLVRRLKPAWAVVSCGAEYNEKKDRPSRSSVELLEQAGARVWFTDCCTLPGRAPDRWRAVEFAITEDGRVLTPDDRESGGR